jgi:hypothetical protein
VKTRYEQSQEIRLMPQNLRLAGYLLVEAKLTCLLSELRLNYDDDKNWPEEDEKKYEDLCDELDPWWYALSEEEKAFLQPITIRHAVLSNGESITNNPFLNQSSPPQNVFPVDYVDGIDSFVYPLE